jgi:hypothetical protein
MKTTREMKSKTKNDIKIEQTQTETSEYFNKPTNTAIIEV